jgi:hypothetical protein
MCAVDPFQNLAQLCNLTLSREPLDLLASPGLIIPRFPDFSGVLNPIRHCGLR